MDDERRTEEWQAHPLLINPTHCPISSILEPEEKVVQSGWIFMPPPKKHIPLADLTHSLGDELQEHQSDYTVDSAGRERAEIRKQG